MSELLAIPKMEVGKQRVTTRLGYTSTLPTAMIELWTKHLTEQRA